VKNLVVKRLPLTREILRMIAGARGCPAVALSEWEGRTISDFYGKAVCGGLFAKYAKDGLRRHEVFVPLAHQSALTGVLLATELVKIALGLTTKGDPPEIRLNALFRPPEHILIPRGKSAAPRCICTDEDYLDVYRRKHPSD
jgi:hypothetical protein